MLNVVFIIVIYLSVIYAGLSTVMNYIWPDRIVESYREGRELLTEETIERSSIMERCDYCIYRNSWDCGDGWNRISNSSYCSEFKLDFDSLSDKQKKQVQRVLMGGDDEYDY
jgi:hypothetical protein